MIRNNMLTPSSPARIASNHTPGRRRVGSAVVALSVATALALSGCQTDGGGRTDGDGRTASGGVDPSPTRVLWIGDSIAGTEAPAIGAALAAAGVEMKDGTRDGGGNVVGGTIVEGAMDISSEIAEETWTELPKVIDSFDPTVIAYQLASYDYGSPERQTEAYERLAATAADAGAELVMVSLPPILIDEFYEPHVAEFASSRAAAETVAEADGDGVYFFDAAELWGTDPSASAALRAADGVHNCQQGAAAFAAWFAEKLSTVTDVTPAAVEEWATGEWTSAESYLVSGLGCS